MQKKDDRREFRSPRRQEGEPRWQDGGKREFRASRRQQEYGGGIDVYQASLMKLKSWADDLVLLNKGDYTWQSRLFLLVLKDREAYPAVLAARYAEKYGQNLGGKPVSGDSVKELFDNCRMSWSGYRKRLFQQAGSSADKIYRLMHGERLKEQIIDEECNRNRSFKLLVMLALLSRCPELRKSETGKSMLQLSRESARSLMDSLLRDLLGKSRDGGQEERRPSEPYRENAALRAELEAKRSLLVQLRESFDEQLEESRLEAQADVMLQLNSDDYGRILDLLASAQKGFDTLRDNHVSIPMELRSMKTLVRKLQEFVRDCGVTPMLEPGTEIDVSTSNVENLQFEGTPLKDDWEVKKGRVVSPGWQIADRGIVISYPRVCEVEG